MFSAYLFPAIPPPPGPGLAAPTTGYPTDPGYPAYPADTVPESTTGTVTPHAVGDEPYYPSAGVPGPGAAGPGATGRSFSDADLIVASIRSRLLPLPDDTVVHTGHGADTTIGAERDGIGWG